MCFWLEYFSEEEYIVSGGEKWCKACIKKINEYNSNSHIQKLNRAIISVLAFSPCANSSYHRKLRTGELGILFSVLSTNELKRDFDLTL